MCIRDSRSGGARRQPGHLAAGEPRRRVAAEGQRQAHRTALGRVGREGGLRRSGEVAGNSWRVQRARQ
eukprot:3399745-Alexandrium_andersonii.AAC.1